jgi:hypothetical protein
MRFPVRNKIAKKCDIEKNVKYRQIIDFTAKCFWYSLGKDWYNHWFVKEKAEKVTNQVVCQIKIKRTDFIKFGEKGEGKILVIDSLEDVKKLKSKYGISKKYTLIDFQRLSKKYSGIEFRNYHQISKKMKENNKLTKNNYNWYYMIGVNSGCVWDTSLITVEEKGKLKSYI